jgi:hypothetical protein
MPQMSMNDVVRQIAIEAEALAWKAVEARALRHLQAHGPLCFCEFASDSYEGGKTMPEKSIPTPEELAKLHEEMEAMRFQMERYKGALDDAGHDYNRATCDYSNARNAWSKANSAVKEYYGIE